MASSMLTGDRRWAPTRKLTVLGKVPKPINLPSQRLENHGLDPNVEIVPKGTLTWGSRPSTPVLNAWGTSSGSSPLTDGSAGSPSHRPSSGGGTRPSTAGSDRSHELVSNAWGPNSRPTSASGVLTSSTILTTSTRPRSADTRPGSSQLSRFADSSIDSTVAWGTTGIAEKLGMSSSKSSGFTLSSGDFPSLGSDKNSDTHSQRGHSSQGRPQSTQGHPQSSQGRPSSACGADSRPKEFFDHGNMNTDHFEQGTVNTWKADNCQYAGHGTSPNIDNWRIDSHRTTPYPNMNMPLPHYDSWHNPPFHPADEAWYRGGAPGGPYRPPGHPGSYPIDYPHASSRPLSNPQQFPRHDAGPGGFYPNNCQPYRPCMLPERYMGPSHTDVPVRPGAYQGPAPYEGYYGPTHPNFYNSLERDTSIMGMSRPVVHNQYATQHQNYDRANFQARPGGCASVMNKEQTEPHQANETLGPYKVLLKQHDGSEDCNETEKTDHSVAAGTPHLGKGKLHGVSSQKGDCGTKSQAQKPVVTHSLPGEAVSSAATSRVDAKCPDTAVRNSLVNSSKVADGLMRGPEAVNVTCGLQTYTVIKKNASLMENVESLNNKARIADSHIEDGPTCREKLTGFKDVIAGADRFTKVASPNDSYVDNAASTLNKGSMKPKDVNSLTEDKNQEDTTDVEVLLIPTNCAGAGENASFLGQRKAHMAKNVDFHAKSRSNRHDNDESMKKAPGYESSMNTAVTGAKGGTLETDTSLETSEKQELLHAARGQDAARILSSVDPVDQNAQRAKMREIAMQRAKQLQHEEEERTREQKAKALAKLEELNRRTLAESSNLKSPLQRNDLLNNKSDSGRNKSESGPSAAPTADATSFDSNAISARIPESVKQLDDCGIKNLGQSMVLSSTGDAQASHSATQSSEGPHVQSSPMEQESNITAEILPETTSDIQHNANSKQKQVGYRKKHSNMQENIGGKQKHISSTRRPTDTNEIVVHAPSSDTLPNMEYQPVQQKKRNNRGSRNNNVNKLVEGLTSSTSTSPLNTAVSTEITCTESGKIETSTLVEKDCESSNENVGSMSSCEVQDVSVNQGLPDSTEDTHGRGNNHWKPHPQRKTTRSQQPNKPVSKYHATEAVMWAPVKPLCKNEAADEVSHNSVTEPTKHNGKSGNDVHNGLKAKRAEIERYVPKPVAKELSQLVNSQQASPCHSQLASADTAGKSEIGLPSTGGGRLDGPAIRKVSAASVTRNRENLKHNKNGKANASWQQLGSSESPATEGSGVSNQAKTVQKAFDQLQKSNIIDVPEGQLTHPDDGWNDNVLPSEPVASTVVGKRYGADDGWKDNNDNVLPCEPVASSMAGKSYGSNRQRRQSYKVHRVSGSNHQASENMGSQQGITDRAEHPTPAWDHAESGGRNIGRNESQSAGGESTKSHWKPKSQANSHGQSENRGNRGAQRTVTHGSENALAMNEDTNTSDQGTKVAEASDARHQESRRERKVTAYPAKEQTGRLAHRDTGHQRDQPVPLGGNMHGQHSGRFHGGYDTSYRGRDRGQENYKQNNVDKRRSNQHVEYQRIGSYDKTGDTFQQNPNAGEGAHEPSQGPGARYRGQGGQHFPRGGGDQFYGRSSGTAARVGDSYNGGEW